MSKDIYLTFDDGPNEPYTSQLLDLLKQHNVKATFFVCGQNIEKSPESIRRIVADGHAIGNHTYFHKPLHAITGEQVSEAAKTNELIERYTGVHTKLFRFPQGISTPWIRATLRKRGYSIYHWNIMVFDWKKPPAERMASHIIARAFPGAIVLMHDGHETKGDVRTNTINAVGTIIPELLQQGYTFQKLTPEYNNRSGMLKNMIIDNLWWLTGKERPRPNSLF